MPMDIDGFAVLGAIARHPELFQSAKSDVAKTARGFVSKQLKDKGLDAAVMRALAEAIEQDSFGLIVDGLSDAEVKALLAKIDKHNASLKAAVPQAQRQHLFALARGTTQPAEKTAAAKPAKAPPPALPARKPVERSGNSKAMRAKKKV